MKNAPSDNFAAALRRFRRAAGLTQETLAERARLSSKAVSALERGARQTPYPETVAALADALALGPAQRDELLGLRRRRRLRALEPSLPLRATSFVGRASELAEVIGLLERHRLVTVTGAGGVGKTRIAIEVASELEATFSDGIRIAEFAPLSSGSFVEGTLARLLGAEDARRPLVESLIAALKPQHTLLVLDNCEHVIGAAALVAAAILRACPRVCILATSREPLRIAGECCYRLPSLTSPAPAVFGALSREEALTYGAIALFVQRARAADPRFAITDDNAPFIAQICRRVDGIALAIELAAARSASLPLLTLAGRLDDRFGILTSGDRSALPRHQTMRALIDWSYELLEPDEAMLLRRVSVFANGFEIEGAIALCPDAPCGDPVSLLAALVDKSLVLAEPGDGFVRYRLLETTRLYALQKLSATGERDLAICHHLVYFKNLFCAARARVERSGVTRELDDLLAIELEDVRTALDAAPAVHRRAGAELVSALDNRWSWIGLTAEGIARLRTAIASTPTDEPQLAARLWTALARALTNDGGRAFDATAIAVDLARRAGDASTLAQALTMRADALAQPDSVTIAEATRVLAEAESLLAAGDHWLRNRMRRVRADALWFSGKLEDAAIAFERLRETHAHLGNVDEANNLALIMAEIEHQRGRSEQAVVLLRAVVESVCASRFRDLCLMARTRHFAYLVALDRPLEAREVSREIFSGARTFDDPDALNDPIEHAALAIALGGDIRRGARLAGYVRAARSEEARPYYAERAARARLQTLLERQLPAQERAELLTAGGDLSVEEAWTLAATSLLNETPAPHPHS